MDVGSKFLRLIMLGEFSTEVAVLATRLGVCGVDVSVFDSIKSLPFLLSRYDVLLTEQSWLRTLSSKERGALSGCACEAAEWIVLSDLADNVLDQVEWLRVGVSHFFQHPLDVHRVASLFHAAHARLGAQSLRAILLDDNQKNLIDKAEALRDAGIDVFATQDPLVALDAVNHFNPDVLVASAHLPSLSARELLVIARQRSENTLLPVIFLTGSADVEAVQLSSCVCFLIEPVGLESLVATLTSQALDYRSVRRGFVQLREDALRARARLKALRSAIDQHAIISVTDGAGNIVHVNDRFCGISGYSRKELLGENHRLVKSNIHTPTYYQDLWQTISSGKVWRGELCNKAKNGDFYWVEATIVPFLDSAGKPAQYMSVRTDITALKCSTDALRLSHERLRLIQNVTSIGTWDLNVANGDVSCSGRTLQLFGYQPGIPKKDYEDFLAAVHADDRQTLAHIINVSLENRTPYEAEFRVVWPDNTVHWLQEKGAVVSDETDGAFHLVGVVQDIQVRKMAEIALAESEVRFRGAFEASGIGMALISLSGAWLLVNSALCSMLGFSEDELLATDLKTLTHSNDYAVDQALLKRFLSGEISSWQHEKRYYAKGGRIVWVLLNISVVHNGDGQYVHFVYQVQDITARKIAEQRLALFRNELADAKKAADQANQAKSDFLSSMSHELRTPMNAVLGFAQMLECDGDLNADQKDSVQEILKGGKHLLGLISEVLDLAKIESGNTGISFEPVALACLLKECWSLTQVLADARHITAHFNVPATIAVYADRVRLKQVFLNLLSNAIKYNREGGNIHVGIQPVGGIRLKITITDTGSGISPKRVPELFQPFNRLDAEHSDIEGTGIGLTISRRLIELMQGTVGVVSEVGTGTTFWVELPAQPTVGLETNHDFGNAAHDSIEPQRQDCALYIDDDPVNVKLITGLFGKRSPIHLVTAVTPQLGIELALGYRPDVILLDLNMQSIDGYKVLDVLDARFENVPIIALTANAMPHDIERALSAGFAKCLTKPIDFGLLMSAVEECLADSKEAQT